MFVEIWRDLLSGSADFLFPRHCCLCQSLLPAESCSEVMFCGECCEGLSRNYESVCGRCGSLVRQGSDPRTGRCADCRGRRRSYRSVTALGLYDQLLQEAVVAAKRDEMLGPALARLLVARCRTPLVGLECDVVVPVPTHWRRRLARGIHAAELMAHAIAGSLDLKTQATLKCVRMTAKQGTLSPAARRVNIRGAFAVCSRASLQGRRVLLVDDVMTSGATVQEAARQLRRAGVQQVHVAVIARGGQRRS